MNEKGFIKYITAIVIVLAVVFLSQQAFFKSQSQTYINFLDDLDDKVSGYWTDASDWVKASLYPQVSSEAQKRGEALQNEATAQKEKISETVGEKIKNYFAGVVDSIFN